MQLDVDLSSRLNRSPVVVVDVVDIDVDEVREGAQPLRAAVVGAGVAEEDLAVADRELGVRHRSVVVGIAELLLEPERRPSQSIAAPTSW